MTENRAVDPSTVNLTAQPLRQGGPQRLSDLLRELDLRPVAEEHDHDVDPDTAQALRVLRDAGLEPEVIGVEDRRPLGTEPPVFMKVLPLDDEPPFDRLRKLDGGLVTTADLGVLFQSVADRPLGFVVEDE